MAISILNAVFILIAISAPVLNLLSYFFPIWFMWIVVGDLAVLLIVMSYLFFERTSSTPSLAYEFLGSPLLFTAYLHALFAFAVFVVVRHALATWYNSTIFAIYALLLIRSCNFARDQWTWRTCIMAILLVVLVDAASDIIKLYLMLSVNEKLSAGKLVVLLLTYVLQLQYVIHLCSFCTKTLWRSFALKNIDRETEAQQETSPFLYSSFV